jgi:hypothetical protein
VGVMKIVDVVPKDLYIQFEMSLSEADLLSKGLGMCKLSVFDPRDQEKQAAANMVQMFSEMVGKTVEEINAT